MVKHSTFNRESPVQFQAGVPYTPVTQLESENTKTTSTRPPLKTKENKMITNQIIKIIPKAPQINIHDTHCEHYDRDIVFQAGCEYAVVLASYYGSKGYTTHKTVENTIKQAKRTKNAGYSCIIIDLLGNVYDLDFDCELAKTGQIDFLDDEPDKYRWECGKLYEYSKEQNGYLFVAAGNGKTKKQTIKEYEEHLLFN